MKQRHISVQARSAATPDDIYDLLADGASWPRWSSFRSFELAEPGPDGGESVGAIRLFRAPGVPIPSRERIIALEPGRRYGYAYLSGILQLRDYEGFVDLEPGDGGTTIHWHSSFSAKVPGTGWLQQAFLTWMLKDFAHRLATYAGEHAPATTSAP